jgi:hypothetical protein
MAYHCNACSYRGQTSGTAGECPACGSYDLQRKSLQSQKTPPAQWRIYLLIGLWTYLIGLVAWKLFT